ncbi:LOW QUALITY PROTEIN: hypothetical protein AAY473_007848 [Plecturocebus cupreus]
MEFGVQRTLGWANLGDAGDIYNEVSLELSVDQLECNGAIRGHCMLELLGSSDPPSSASYTGGTTGLCHHGGLILLQLSVDMGFSELIWSVPAGHRGNMAFKVPSVSLKYLTEANIPGNRSPEMRRLEFSGAVTAHCSLNLLGSSNPTVSAPQVAGTTGTPPGRANFCIFQTGFHYVAQAGLKFLSSGDPPDSASQSAGITGVNHCTWAYLAREGAEVEQILGGDPAAGSPRLTLQVEPFRETRFSMALAPWGS